MCLPTCISHTCTNIINRVHLPIWERSMRKTNCKKCPSHDISRHLFFFDIVFLSHVNASLGLSARAFHSFLLHRVTSRFLGLVGCLPVLLYPIHTPCTHTHVPFGSVVSATKLDHRLAACRLFFFQISPSIYLLLYFFFFFFLSYMYNETQWPNGPKMANRVGFSAASHV